MSTLHRIRMPGSRPEPEGFLERFGEYAFRPLFLLLVLQALGMITLWVCWWTGLVTLPWARDPLQWHVHEMLTGFAGAAIGGFLLTAVATWTGRPPVGGWRLGLLCLFWAGGRLSLFFPLSHAVFDIAYWLGLWLLMAGEVVGAGNRRNYKILVILGLLLASDAAWHVNELLAGPWLRQAGLAQLWLVLLLIAVIGGRIIPAFTGNWLKRRAVESGAPPPDAASLPPAFTRFDLACIVSLLLYFVASLLPAPLPLLLVLGWLAALLHALRLWRWQGLRCLADPLVWMLHLSYAWLPLGLALHAASAPGWVPASAGIHALTIGCMAGMILSVSSRAALGHSQRPLRSHPLLTTAIVALNLAALLRVCAAVHPAWSWLLGLSALAWVLAMLAYATVYLPILLGAKPAAP